MRKEICKFRFKCCRDHRIEYLKCKAEKGFKKGSCSTRRKMKEKRGYFKEEVL